MDEEGGEECGIIIAGAYRISTPMDDLTGRGFKTESPRGGNMPAKEKK